MRLKDEDYMAAAYELAALALQEQDIPVGAVVVTAEGEIVGRGRNLRRIKHDPTAHAEIVALRDAAVKLNTWTLSGCTMFVTLEPCPMCAGALVQARIARLVYGCADPKAGACGTLYNITSDSRLFHRLSVAGGVMEQPCREILQDFFIKCRQRKKADR